MTVLPERLMSLPDEIAVGHLSEAVLQERAPILDKKIDLASVSVPTTGDRAVESIRELVDEAHERFEATPTEADAWLAPRVHAALRLTRAEAADSGLWNHLALRVAPDHVYWRHMGGPTKDRPIPSVARSRFVGPFHTQAFARLWWAAELFRDGYDYRPAVVACQSQDILNNVLRLTIILHRPTAQAILRLAADGTLRTGREANALAKVVNAAGSTLSFETIAPDAPPDPDAYLAWVQDRDDALLPLDTLPDGPDDGRTPPVVVKRLADMFEKFFAEAPVRGKESLNPDP